jgi:hypothetical protein
MIPADISADAWDAFLLLSLSHGIVPYNKVEALSTLFLLHVGRYQVLPKLRGSITAIPKVCIMIDSQLCGRGISRQYQTRTDILEARELKPSSSSPRWPWVKKNLKQLRLDFDFLLSVETDLLPQ